MLLGVITKTELLRLVTTFHGHKDTSLTLSSAMGKKEMEKPSWLGTFKEFNYSPRPHPHWWNFPQGFESQ